MIQALARIIVGEQMVKISEKYRPALTVHDAAVIVAPKAEAEEAMQFMLDIMHTPPEWGKTLPVASEAGMGESYGEC